LGGATLRAGIAMTPATEADHVKLYWSWFINPQKVRLALNELDFPHQIIELRLLRGEQRALAFLDVNPNGKVPVIEHEGLTLWESNAILAYLGDTAARLWPTTAAARGEALRWMFFESCHLQGAIGLFWFSDFVAERADLAGEEKVVALQLRAQAFDDAKRREAQATLERFLPLIERRLTEQPWMLGKKFSVVDCCYGAQLDALQLSQWPLSSYPAIESYVDRIRTRPAWAACDFKTDRARSV
jgi:glutathione S-transferase